MQKKLLLLGTVLLSMPLIFGACKEIPVGVSEAAFTDTTYTVTTIPDADLKKVLIEDFSGVSCVNCGIGSELLETLNSTTFKDKLNIASIFSGPLSGPLDREDQITGEHVKTIQDFQCAEGDEIANVIFGGITGQPAMSVDRLPLGPSDNYFGDRGTITSMIQQDLNLNASSPVNIDVTGASLGNNEYQVHLKVTYTKALEGRQGITVYLLENNIQDYQLYPDYTHTLDSIPLVTFEHVFRKYISSLNGDEILSGTTSKPAGTVLERTYTFTIDPSDEKEALWRPENIDVLAFVHKTGEDDKQVYQSATVKLVQ